MASNTACRERHILVVDDHPLLRAAIGEALAAEGYRVAEAADGSEALDRLSHGHFCAALIDMHMPVMDGLSLVHAMGERGIRCPVLLTSAAADPGERPGAIAFHAKPVRLAALLHDLDEVTSGCSAALP